MQFGYISIENGRLIATCEEAGLSFEEAANRRGAIRLGKALAAAEGQIGVDGVNWYYSSSIDFPHEYGGSRINFRSAIAEGRGLDDDDVFDPINGGRRP